MEPLQRVLTTSFDDVLARMPEALKTEGFGILTEIDVQATLKKKLDADFRRYRILGACNPPFAKQALELDLEVGRFMPCSVAVYEDDAHNTVVSVVDPTQTLVLGGESAAMRELAVSVREKLARALSRL